MRGRKPIPAALKEAKGDSRKVGARKFREQLAAEPSATRGLPPCPRHVKGRALAAWKFWADELADMNLDRRPDAMMLEGACVNYGRAVEADLILARDGMMVEESIIDEESKERIVLKIRTHPAEGISRRAWILVRAFCSEFGLSPVSRTRLTIEKKDDGPDLATLLATPRAPRPVVQ